MSELKPCPFRWSSGNKAWGDEKIRVKCRDTDCILEKSRIGCLNMSGRTYPLARRSHARFAVVNQSFALVLWMGSHKVYVM